MCDVEVTGSAYVRQSRDRQKLRKKAILTQRREDRKEEMDCLYFPELAGSYELTLRRLFGIR